MTEPRKKVLLVRDDLSECRHIVEVIDEPSQDQEIEPREEDPEDLCYGL